MSAWCCCTGGRIGELASEVPWRRTVDFCRLPAAGRVERRLLEPTGLFAAGICDELSMGCRRRTRIRWRRFFLRPAVWRQLGVTASHMARISTTERSRVCLGTSVGTVGSSSNSGASACLGRPSLRLS